VVGGYTKKKRPSQPKKNKDTKNLGKGRNKPFQRGDKKWWVTANSGDQGAENSKKEKKKKKQQCGPRGNPREITRENVTRTEKSRVGLSKK